MNEQLTREFVKRWNEKNGYEDGLTVATNMRYVRDGVVTWNQYDAEEVDIAQFANIYAELEIAKLIKD